MFFGVNENLKVLREDHQQYLEVMMRCLQYPVPKRCILDEGHQVTNLLSLVRLVDFPQEQGTWRLRLLCFPQQVSGSEEMFSLGLESRC